MCDQPLHLILALVKFLPGGRQEEIRDGLGTVYLNLSNCTFLSDGEDSRCLTPNVCILHRVCK